MGIDMRIINGVRYRPEDAPAQPEPTVTEPAAPTTDEDKANQTAKAKTAKKTGKEA